MYVAWPCSLSLCLSSKPISMPSLQIGGMFYLIHSICLSTIICNRHIIVCTVCMIMCWSALDVGEIPVREKNVLMRWSDTHTHTHTHTHTRRDHHGEYGLVLFAAPQVMHNIFLTLPGKHTEMRFCPDVNGPPWHKYNFPRLIVITRNKTKQKSHTHSSCQLPKPKRKHVLQWNAVEWHSDFEWSNFILACCPSDFQPSITGSQWQTQHVSPSLLGEALVLQASDKSKGAAVDVDVSYCVSSLLLCDHSAGAPIPNSQTF